MKRLLIDLARSSWRSLLPPVVLFLFVTFKLWEHDFSFISLLTLGYGTSYLIFWWRYMPQLIKHAAPCVRAAHPPMVFYHDPDVDPNAELSSIVETARTALDELQECFGFRPRRPVLIFVFSQWRHISHIFGKQYGGTALARANAICVATDNFVHESIRHELTHLFTARWNLCPLPLLGEGLATWQQQTHWGQPVDALAREWLDSVPDLTALVDPKAFFREEHVQGSYILAGSFTGFLIRKYGWERYRRFFKIADAWHAKPSRFQAAFEKCFGLPLAEAERRWRTEVVVMPVLKERLERALAFY